MRTYSIYEAKTKLSAILRQVREGATVLISYHGKPIAEIRPVANANQSMEERMEELVQRGVLTRPVNPKAPLRPIARRPGALRRFLEERGE